MRLDHLLSREKLVYCLVLRVHLSKKCLSGGVAQLGEHLPCTQGVRSSSLLISTIKTFYCTLKTAYQLKETHLLIPEYKLQMIRKDEERNTNILITLKVDKVM